MARLEKLAIAFKRCSGTFPWRDCARLLEALGYRPVKLAGGTRGSRRRYHNPETGHTIMLDVPHDGKMRPGMVRRLRDELTERGLL